MDVHHQLVDTRVDLVSRRKSLLALGNVDIGHITRQQACALVAQRARCRHRRVDQLVDRLRLATLLELQCLDVAQGVHRWRVPVDVLACQRPAWRHGREIIVARLTQHLLVGVAGLVVAGPEALELRRWPALVVLVVGLDDVNHVDPRIHVAALVQILGRLGHLLDAKLSHQLAGRHLKFAVAGVDVATVGRAQHVAAHRERVAANHILVILEHCKRIGAKHAQIAVSQRQRGVQVGSQEDFLHAHLDHLEPQLDRRELV